MKKIGLFAKPSKAKRIKEQKEYVKSAENNLKLLKKNPKKYSWTPQQIKMAKELVKDEKAVLRGIKK